MRLDYRGRRELWEWETLAPFAARSSDPSLNWRRSESAARTWDTEPVRDRHSWPPFHRPASRGFTDDPAGTLSRFKTAFQIDIERITGSTAFRRLEHKTQVFVTHEGDHFRTRLTHVVEVRETARIIAQLLQINEDLVEAISLGHDLGHTPFGHDGESALSEMFERYWPETEKAADHEHPRWGVFGPRFYHNVQSVRVVDTLEKGYEWDMRPPIGQNSLRRPLSARGWGMDLCWAVREGILKHSSRGLRKGQIRMYGSEYLMDELDPFAPATMEGQVVEYADEIASIMHDLEDGLRYRLFTLDQLTDGLVPYLNHGCLEQLLGLPRDLDDDPALISRLQKLIGILENLKSKKERTVGTVLALLRTVLVSNLTETTSMRIRQAMYDRSEVPELNEERCNALREVEPCEDRAYLLATVQMHSGDSSEPTEHGYCPDAWDPSQPPARHCYIKLFHRKPEDSTDNRSKLYELREEHKSGDAKLFWHPHCADETIRRHVYLETSRGLTAYPLRQVCVRFTGCKVVGFSPAVQDLCRWLKREFIPENIHQAPLVVRMNYKGRQFLKEIFERFVESPASMHIRSLTRFGMQKPVQENRKVQANHKFILRIVEHLQGMTDRYAEQMYTRLFLPGGQGPDLNEISLVDGDQPPFPMASPLDLSNPTSEVTVPDQPVSSQGG